MPPTVPDMIRDLRRSHYAGAGGSAALAAVMQVHPQTLKNWRSGKALPTFARREALTKLWREHCGEKATE